MTVPAAASPPSRLYAIVLPDGDVLRHYYMSHVESGGLFLPTANPLALGEEVLLLLRLDDSSYASVGRVVWKTPPNAPNGRRAGVGVQFISPAPELEQAIDAVLARALSDKKVPCATY